MSPLHPRRLATGLLSLAVVSTLCAAPSSAAPRRHPHAVTSFQLTQVSGFLDEDHVAKQSYLSADGNRVLYQASVEGDDPSLLLRDLSAQTTTLVDHAYGDPHGNTDYEATSYALSADGGTVVFASHATNLLPDADWPGNGYHAYVTDTAGGPVRLIPQAGGGVREVAVSDDGTRAAILTDAEPGTTTARILFVDLVHLTTLRTIDLPSNAGTGVALSGDASTIAVATADDETTFVRVIDAATGDTVADRRDDDSGRPSLDTTGRHVAYPGGDERFLVWDRAHPDDDPEQVPVLPGTTPESGSLSGDGRTFAWGDDPLDDDDGFGSSVAHVSYLDTSTGEDIAGRASTGFGDPGVPATDPELSRDASTIALYVDGQIVVATHKGADADVTPPTWPVDAALTTTALDSRRVRVGWPAASDDVAVRSYDVLVDGTPVDTLPPTKLTDVVTLSAPSATVAVRAVDTSGNDGPQLTATARTLEPLRVDDSGVDYDQLHLTYAAPADRTGITALRVLRADAGGTMSAPVVDDATFTTLDDLPLASRSYTDTPPKLLHDYAYRIDAVHADGSTTVLTETSTAATGRPGRGTLAVGHVGATHATLTWPAAPANLPVKDFVIKRDDDGGTPTTTVATVPAGTTSWTDTTLQERSGYDWQVVAEYDGGWPAAEWTDTARAITPQGGVQSLELVADTTPDGYAYRLGAPLVVRVQDEAGLTGEARIYGDDHTLARTLPLHETQDGLYVTDAITLDGTDLTAVDHVDVTLTDGTRTDSDTAAGKPVGGRADVTIAGADDDLPGLHLVFANGVGHSWPATAPGSAHVDLEPDTYDVTLETSDHDVVAERDGVVIGRAQAVRLALTPQRHAQLTVTLHAPDGEPAAAGTVTVTGADGTVLGREHLAGDGGRGYLYGLPVRSTLHVTFAPDDPAVRVRVPAFDVTTGTGEQAVAVTETSLGRADLAVSLTGNGWALGGGTLTLTQTADGRTFTTTATTGDDGSAVLHGIPGDGRVTAQAPFYTTSATAATLVRDASTPLHFDLLRTATYRIHPHLVTRSLDGTDVEQPLDWRTAGHFNATLAAQGRSLPVSGNVAWDGAAGDTVTFCADGHDAGLGRACSTITLTDDREPAVTVTLGQAATASAHLVDETGAALGHWSADLYRELPTGGSDWVGHQNGNGADAVLGTADAGEYSVIWSDGDGRRGTSRFTVADGDRAALGAVTVSAAQAAPAAVDAQALPATVEPGAVLTYRIALPASTGAAALRLTVPAGASAADGTATVNAGPVASTLDHGVVTVPLRASDAAVVRIPVTIATTSTDGDLTAAAELVPAAGAARQLDPIHATVQRLTLQGPTSVAAPTFTVTGRAAPGDTVTVRDDNGVVLGTGTAGPGGLWHAAVTLRSPLDGSAYTLTASAPTSGPDALSDPLRVTFDADGVVATSVTLDNSTPDAPGRRVTYDPREGSAAFSMVYVPGAPVRVTATFGSDASRVYDFTAYVGDLEAEGTCGATTCTAVLPAGEASDVGDVYLGYSVAARPVTSLFDGPAPTLDQLVHSAPAPFNAPQDTDFTVTDAGNVTGRWTIAGVPVTSSQSLTPVDTLPAATPTDAAVSKAAGLQVRGLTLAKVEDGDHYRIEISGVVDGSAARLPSARRALSGLPEAPGYEFKDVVDLGKRVKAWAELLDIIESGAKSPELDALDKYVDDNLGCDPEVAADLHDRIFSERSVFVVDRLGLNGFSWLSIAGGSWSTLFKVSDENLLKDGFNQSVNELLKKGTETLDKIALDRATQAVKDASNGMDGKACDARVKFRPRDYRYPSPRRSGSPTWIFDPSGHAYTGTPDHPLAGVTATIYRATSASGPWTPWNAADYGQTNPQVTAGDGAYGWDVPLGWYQIRWSRPGYTDAVSAPMQVLPEHFGVDVDLRPAGSSKAKLVRASAHGDTVTVEFDRDMTVRTTAAALGLREKKGGALAASVAAQDATTTPQGVPVARTFVFTLTGVLTPKSVVRVRVAASATDATGTKVRVAAKAVRVS